MPDNSTSELIGGLNLVGTSGNFCAILTEQQLTLERIDGRGIRLELKAIDRMRHLRAPMLPAGTIFLGLILIYLGFTTIVQPLNIISIIAGLGIVGMNIISRYSILALETNSGDRHLISGTEGNLLKLCMMVERIRHGSSMIEARLGLEGLETEIPTFPALQDAKGVLGLGQKNSPELTGLIESEFLNLPKQKKGNFENSDDVAIVDSNDATEFSLIKSEDSVKSRSGLSAYEKAWGQPAPHWYSERNIDEINNNRLNSAASEAAESLDLFADGGIFDDSPVETQNDEFLSNFQENYEVQKSVSSSSQMIKNAFDKYGEPEESYMSHLPPPTEIAVRDECKAGIVKQAMAKKELKNNNISRRMESKKALGDYPGINKLASSMGVGRSVNIGSEGVKKSTNWLGRLLGGGTNNFQNTISKRKSGNENILIDHKNKHRFQSSQHIRLRSDQEHQAQIRNRIIRMNSELKNSHGQKALGKILTRVSVSDELRLNSDNADNQLRFSDLRATSSEDDPHPLPGIKRLG